VAKNSQSNRTTLWDDPSFSSPGTSDAVPDGAPQATVSRGAWRAPSAVLGDRAPRRPIPSITPEDDDLDAIRDDGRRIPRRTKFAPARTPWWRPRTTFGRVLLGTVALIVLAALISLGVITRRFLTHDAHFRITGAADIQSTGLSEVNRADVLPVFGEDIGRNIFFVPLAERRKQLEAIPWVQQATVMRFLPDHLSVNIVERTPVALVMQGNQVELVDADGVILSMPPAMMAQHHYSFPVIHGIDAKDSLEARRARMAVYQRFAAELDQNNQHLMNQVSEIDLTDPEDLRATMPEQGSDILAHFGEDQFLRRLQIYKSHITEWRTRYPRLIGVDLRYNGEVPLEMAKVSGADKSVTVSAEDGTAIAKPAAKPTETAAAKPKPVAKTPPEKTAPASQKAADAKKKAAQKTAKAKAAKPKPVHHPGTPAAPEAR
jgi:cell division protein FtsQ